MCSNFPFLFRFFVRFAFLVFWTTPICCDVFRILPICSDLFKLRKILVSVKFLSAILGPEMAAPILWAPGKMRSFCRKNHVHKIPPLGGILGFGGETPTPKIAVLLRKRPVLLRANFVLTKDRKRPSNGHFCGEIHREGSCSKAAGGP